MNPWERDYSGAEASGDEVKKPWEQVYIGTGISEERAPEASVEDYTRSAVQGATFGYGDEIEAYTTTVGTEKDYDSELSSIRSEMGEFNENNAGTSIITEMIGGVPYFFIPGVGWTKAAQGASKLANIGKNIGKLGAEGAGYGAAYGSGTSEGEIGSNEFFDDTLKGAAVGAVASPAIVGGVQAAKPVLRGIKGDINPESAEKIKTLTDSLLARANRARKELTEAEINKHRQSNAYGVLGDFSEADLQRTVNGKYWDEPMKGTDGEDLPFTYGQFQNFNDQVGNVKNYSDMGGLVGLQRVIGTSEKKGGAEIARHLGLRKTVYESVGESLDKMFPGKGKSISEWIGLRNADLGKVRKDALDRGLDSTEGSLNRAFKSPVGLTKLQKTKNEAAVNRIQKAIKDSLDEIRDGKDVKSAANRLFALQGRGKRGDKGFVNGGIADEVSLSKEQSDAIHDIVNTSIGYSKLKEVELKGGNIDASVLSSDLVGKIAGLGGAAYLGGIPGMFAAVSARKGVNAVVSGANKNRLKQVDEAFNPKSVAGEVLQKASNATPANAAKYRQMLVTLLPTLEGAEKQTAIRLILMLIEREDEGGVL
jgi:hypothetical protein